MVASEDSLRFPAIPMVRSLDHPHSRCWIPDRYWLLPLLERGIMTALANAAWFKTQLRTLALNLLRLVQLMRLLLPSHWLRHLSEASFIVVNDVVNKIAFWIVQLAFKPRDALFITRRSRSGLSRPQSIIQQSASTLMQ